MSPNAVRLATLTLLVLVHSAAMAAEHTADSLETVKENVLNKKAVLVDVRDPIEWRAGHVIDALPVPFGQLERKKPDPALFRNLPKDKILYTYCVVGMRAKKAADLLTRHGYQVRALKPGYDQLRDAGFPTAKGD